MIKTPGQSHTSNPIRTSTPGIPSPPSSASNTSHCGTTWTVIQPVTAGCRITLTYTLRLIKPAVLPVPIQRTMDASSNPDPKLQRLTKSLSTALSNPKAFPTGGALGFHLRHLYLPHPPGIDARPPYSRPPPRHRPHPLPRLRLPPPHRRTSLHLDPLRPRTRCNPLRSHPQVPVPHHAPRSLAPSPGNSERRVPKRRIQHPAQRRARN
ncbi:hypothetical protein BDV98DRAFT_568399 [Pterulicium gracile]|uniref:Uncharacterized protein n=1 Tax=Pterulicium gracile TaxID=1884261 RepID=A0A5C3QH42_9AGAR|nr:hypothetical protein BDV98DRAFT_568399 [Pterula gracilis]